MTCKGIKKRTEKLFENVCAVNILNRTAEENHRYKRLFDKGYKMDGMPYKVTQREWTQRFIKTSFIRGE